MGSWNILPLNKKIMAKNKKSFLLYCDLIHTIEKMPKEKAGELFLHILNYVNDKNPVTEDLIIQLTFEPIKQQLKRDLVKYAETSLKRSEIGRLAGIKSGEARRTKLKQTEPIGSILNQNEQDTVIDTDTVNDTVKVNDNDILLKKESKFDFRKNLIDYGFSEKLVVEWLQVRKNKKATNTETAFKKFIQQVESTGNLNINEILETCVERSWSGFKKEWLNNLQKNNGKQQSANEKRLESLRTFENKLDILLSGNQPD